MIKTVIFDFDGTLVDSQKDVFESLAHAFSSSGITVNPLDPEIIMQQQLPDAIRLSAPGISDEQREKVIKAFIDHYDKSDYPNTMLMPGVMELLTGLKERAIQMLIVSNKRTKPMVRILDNLKLRTFFSDIFNPDMDSDPAKTKTKSELIAAVIDKYHLPKAATAYVGDMEVDVIAAKENGLIAVAVINGYAKVETFKIRPDYAIQRISDFLAITNFYSF